MNNEAYFKTAVIIAVSVPLLLGIVTFKNIHDFRGTMTYAKDVDGKNEILFFGEDYIENLNLENIKNNEYEKGNHISFSVKFPSGMGESSLYTISLSGITFSPNIDPKDFSWRLLRVNKGGETLISEGTFESMKNNNINLATDVSIDLNDEHNYMLYYYNSSQVIYKRGTLNAKVIIR